ncbi:ImmA/IrrE family metallo-endopeptidase [Methylorubrum thiocyanatum]|uniref:ImmA/IrrE family metallo-endopeptidase n=1 Tax=Methylorubrum thiocyanatum TaxID=47958 RepID=UPI00398C4C40
MIDTNVVLNEREAREARAVAAQFDQLLSSEKVFEPIIAGLPAQVANAFRKSLSVQRNEIYSIVAAYESAKVGNWQDLQKRAGADLGVALIIARIARQLTQKDLARKLGLKEQQIQRYEADRYRSISLSNFQRVARVLGLRWKPDLSPWSASGWDVAQDISAVDVKKILKHARENQWFEGIDKSDSDEESFSYLHRDISDHIAKYGTPALLRTGLVSEDHSNDILLVAWKARVARVASSIIKDKKIEYCLVDATWLLHLVRLSKLPDGPAQARALLLEKGIVLVVERQIPGMKVDGAAFLVDGIPVVGLTLRRDTIDNFWFTLMHEVGHVLLHYRSGLNAGFFDDMHENSLDEVEREANEFASNMLIPDEKWKRSPARISKAVGVIEKFANELGIHPAIVFGRIQKERDNYSIFSDMIGAGTVRSQLISNR